MNQESSIILLHGLFDWDTFDILAERGVKDNVYVLEGRPTLVSSRRSCRELAKRGITPTLIADNMAGFLFYKSRVQEVWLSYQATDENGALCLTGSLILAVLAKRHRISVKAFPASENIKFMGRPKDLQYFNGKKVVASSVKTYAPLVETVSKEYLSVVQPAFKYL